ncbi:MAG: single-stranded-DNA-specific exonuclease RecJ [Verrucomicrobia bacterium]|jgi:single-stranded-DNA-specific exonuclease|nr:single-stranded-DNA-specific exonuclease RecJ [Verrucomicrobiota bacterium]
MNFRWSIAPIQDLQVKRLSEEFDLSPLLAQCLLNRGHSDFEQVDHFLRPKLKNLSDPFTLPNVQRAVDRLLTAREMGQKVVVFGDYDVDGVTSTALIIEVLRELGWKIDFYLPHRLEEGYGLSQDGVENCLKKHNPDLILAVDCGSTAVDTIRWLKDRGLDVIVLDHHQVTDPQPEAYALVNPQLNGGDLCELSSVGLAFKLAHAVIKACRELNQPPSVHDFDMRPLLDLVALGTVADLVPLTGENRVLVTTGLKRLNQTRRAGLLALMEIAQVRDEVGVFEISFQLSPRINAAGRLVNADTALRLMLSDNLDEARKLAQELDTHNKERQTIEKGIADQAIGTIRSQFDSKRDYVIIEGQMYWHIGVVGIVASRVLREFYRPTIILGGEGTEWRGSGRSVNGFDLAEALRTCDDLLVRHGGHAMAAGMSIDPKNLEKFRKRINAYAEQQMTKECLTPILHLDADVPLAELTLDRMEELGRLNPFGAGNSALQFASRRVSLQSQPHRMGREQQHVKFWVSDGRTSYEVLWWNCGKSKLPTGCFDIAYAPQINDYNGRRSVQLKLLDWRPVT